MSITITNSSVFFDKNDIVTADGSTFFAEGFRSVLAGDLSPFKNRIINGDMRIDQRNEGYSLTPTSSNAYPFVSDRFRVYNSTSTSYLSGQTMLNPYQDDTPEGHTSYLRVTTLANGYNSSGNNDHFGIYTIIEGYDTYDLFYGSGDAVPAILSFWVRSSRTGNYSVSFRNHDYLRSLVQKFSVTSVNTWQKIYIFVPPCGDGNWEVTSETGIRITWNLGIGNMSYSTNIAGAWIKADPNSYIGITGQTNINSSYPIGTTFDLTGVQFEKCINPTFPAWIVSNLTGNNSVTSAPDNVLVNPVVVSGDIDDSFVQLDLPFPIDFLGSSYSTIYVGTNGYITFGSSSTSYPAALTSLGIPHLGFLKGDRRLLSLKAGPLTSLVSPYKLVSPSYGSSGNTYSDVYIIRWEGYSYGGSNSNKSIVEIRFYKEKIKGNSIIDVIYVQHPSANGIAYIEIGPAVGNGGTNWYPLQYAVNTSNTFASYRVVMPPAKVVKDTGTDYYWNTSNEFNDHSITLNNLVNNEIYTRIGASTYTFTSKPIEFLKCQRYYQKTYSEGMLPWMLGGGGLYPYFRDGTASAVQRYVPYMFSGDMRNIPSFKIYDYAGNLNKASSDGTNGYSADLSSIGTSMGLLYFSQSMPSHHSIYAYVLLDAELL